MKKVCIALPTKSLKVTSYYGYRIHPITKKQTMHNGIDIGYSGNFVSPFRGTVTEVYSNSVRGDVVVVQYEDKVDDLYVRCLGQHLKDKSTVVKVGDFVKARQILAQTGTTGASTGIHLHFEIQTSEDSKNWQTVDPIPYLILVTSHKISHTLSKDKNQWPLETLRLQQILNTYLDVCLKEDGRFGDKTELAVKEYQRKYELEEDGIFGPACLAKLNRINKSHMPRIDRKKK